MANHHPSADHESRVAVLVDCDNTTPEILEYALRVVAQFGRVVLRRGYGNHSTLANKWQEALVRLAFTPCLQYQYAAGKNTSDIALALDAMEALFDRRADTFCLVTSDSDFAYLCRKLRERGATVHIVGEAKSPDALRNASDQFFEWVKPEAPRFGSTQDERKGRGGQTRPRQTHPKTAAAAGGRRGHPAGRRGARRQGESGWLGFVPQARRPLVFPQEVRAPRPARNAQDLHRPCGRQRRRRPLGERPHRDDLRLPQVRRGRTAPDTELLHAHQEIRPLFQTLGLL